MRVLCQWDTEQCEERTFERVHELLAGKVDCRYDVAAVRDKITNTVMATSNSISVKPRWRRDSSRGVVITIIHPVGHVLHSRLSKFFCAGPSITRPRTGLIEQAMCRCALWEKQAR